MEISDAAAGGKFWSIIVSERLFPFKNKQFLQLTLIFSPAAGYFWKLTEKRSQCQVDTVQF